MLWPRLFDSKRAQLLARVFCDYTVYVQEIGPLKGSDFSVSASSGHVGEVLLRHRNPETGEINYPNSIIPGLRQRGLMGLLTEFVVRETLKCLAALPQDMHLTFNLDPREVRLQLFLFLLSVPRKDRQRLVIELTEHSLLYWHQKLLVILISLIGYSFAVDDCLTEHSTLGRIRWLRRFCGESVEVVKVDRLYVYEGVESLCSVLLDIFSVGDFSVVVIEGVQEAQHVGIIKEAIRVFSQGRKVESTRPIFLVQGFLMQVPCPMDVFIRRITGAVN